jgi:CRP/FNR family cyclic AMP-dependent transcriptional regulator
MVNQCARVLSVPVLRKKFGPGLTVRNCRDKEVVFSQGDKGDAVFYIQSGTVKLTTVCTRHRKAVLALLQRGSFFGEGSLSERSSRIFTARSVGSSTIIRLPKKGVARILKRDSHFVELFISYLLSRIVKMEEDLVDQFFNFSERRLARVLLMFDQISEQSKPERPLKVSQTTLSEMVGTTRGRVNHFMNSFKKKGFVTYDGGVLQVNKKSLTALLQSKPLSVITKAHASPIGTRV